MLIMEYSEISELSAPEFKRLYDALLQAFQVMMKIVQTAQAAKKLPGCPSKLSISGITIRRDVTEFKSDLIPSRIEAGHIFYPKILNK